MIFKDGMKGRILRSFGADTLGQVLNVGIRLLLVPLFLSSWGADAYGEWLILTAIAAWIALGDLGGQLYFINRLTEEWAKGDYLNFQRVYASGLLLFMAASGLLMLLVSIVLYLLPIGDLLAIKTLDQSVVKIVLLLIALKFLVALPIGLMLGVYRAIGFQATSVMYGNLMLLIQFIASVLALSLGGGMVSLAALEVLPFLLISYFALKDLRKRLPFGFSLLTFRQADRSVLLEAISPSAHFLGLQLSAALMIQGSVLVIAKTLGPVEVAIFSSMRVIANVVSRIMGVFAHAAWPEMTRLASLGEDVKLEKLFSVVMQLSLIIGICYVMAIVNFGEIAYNWWLNSQLPYDNLVMYLLSCQVVLTVMWTWGGNLLMATNRHEKYSQWLFPVNLLAIFIAYWGAVEFGMVGAVIGLILGQFLPMVVILYLLLKKENFEQIARKFIKYSVIGALLLPLASNIWSGLLMIVVMGMVIVRERFLYLKG